MQKSTVLSMVKLERTDGSDALNNEGLFFSFRNLTEVNEEKKQCMIFHFCKILWAHFV